MMKDDCWRDAYDRWKRAPREEKPGLFDELMRSRDWIAALDALASDYRDPSAQYEIASMLSETSFAPRAEPVEVRTIASYYYCVSGGGIESSLVSLSHILSERRNALIVTEGECGSEADRKGVPGLSIVSSKKEEESRTEAFARILGENQVDVLVYHAWFDSNLLWDLVLCRMMGIKLVLNVHGVFSHFLDVTDGAFAVWNDGRLFASVPRVVGLCDAVVSQTAVNKWFFSQFNGRSFEIRNTLSLDLVERLGGSAPTNDDGAVQVRNDIILWVGRFDVYKRPEDAVRILARVRERRPRAKLVLVGESGYETYEQELADLAQSLGVSDAVRFEGFQKNVEPYYEQASVVLLTSEIEGYCMVLAEACAHGLPIVAYDLPYLPFSSCKGIEWVSQEDVEEAAERIVSILGDESKGKAMGEASRLFITTGEGARSEDSWDDVIRSLETGSDFAASEMSSMNATMWDTLFYHYLRGADRAHRELERQKTEAANARHACQATERLLEACRYEYESSYSYRLGHALLAAPRCAARLFRRRSG